jgi:queuine tRNA-ribosyltransferase
MFTVEKESFGARAGVFDTVHGKIKTPVFMNVMTAAAIRGGASSEDLENVGCQVALSNTYHLGLRPGEAAVKAMGGLRKFMDWKGPLLTDSGGFQVFSLENIRRISEEGVSFCSYIDGKRIFMGPEESLHIQASLGSTIAMAFDECVKNPAPKNYVASSIERTTRWLKRSKAQWEWEKAQSDAVNPHQLLFAINQGGTYSDLRIAHAKQIVEVGADGYAIGGLAVGEEAEVMYEVIDSVIPFLPNDRPRYLMGVGTPLNILEAVKRGVDFFDCVLPQRNAKRGNVFTFSGRRYLLNEKYRLDERPIEEGCTCPACRRYSRAYIRHLLKADERLGMRLCILHNLWFYNHFVEEIREKILKGEFEEYYKEKRNILGILL